jgi:hypothetical protein
VQNAKWVSIKDLSREHSVTIKEARDKGKGSRVKAKRNHGIMEYWNIGKRNNIQNENCKVQNEKWRKLQGAGR